MKKTFIMLVAGIDDTLTQAIVNHLVNYIGIMNIDTNNSDDLPGIIYNGTLTKAQKLEMKQFLASRTDYNIVPLFIEFTNEEDNEDFIGTLSIVHDYDKVPVPQPENIGEDYNSFTM